MIVGAVAFTQEDVERLALALVPLVAAQLQHEPLWLTPRQYVEQGHAPSEGAVRQRVRRGTITSRKEGGRLLVQGPSI